MGLAADFREFAVKGNAMDLAVGVIIGAAFSKIVDSIVNDLIMPVVGAIFGGLDFSSKFIVLSEVACRRRHDARGTKKSRGAGACLRQLFDRTA